MRHCRFRCCCVTCYSSRKDMREGTIKELVLKETIPPIYTQIAWHKDKWMTVPLQQFIDVTREFLQRIKWRNICFL